MPEGRRGLGLLRATRRQVYVAAAIVGGAVLFWAAVVVGSWSPRPSSGRCAGSQRQVVAAAAGGETEHLRDLLHDAEGADAPDSDGFRPLYCAVARGQTSAAEVLLDAGANPNLDSRAEDGTTNLPLNIAASTNRSQAATLLLDHHADPNAQADGHAALNAAIENQSTEVVRVLLDRGADPNLADAHGVPLLYLASYESNVAIGRLLLDHGANVNVSNDGAGRWCPDLTTSRRGCSTPLGAAAAGRHRDLVTLALDHGADPTTGLYGASVANDLETTRLLLDRGAKPNTAPSNSALLYDVVFGNEDLIQLLLDRGADPNFGGPADAHELQDDVELLRRLPDLAPEWSKHADQLHASVCRLHGTATNFPPLVFAAALGDMASVQLLLGHGADPAATADFQPPLSAREAARASGQPDVVAALGTTAAPDESSTTGGTSPPVSIGRPDC